VSMSVGGAGSAVAAPTSGPIDSMAELKGTWLTSLSGFQEGQPVSWQHRLIVRKVLGSAAVAWEEWRDCVDHTTECKAGKATGDGWTAPRRVPMVMDPKGVVYGVGSTGTLMLTPDDDEMTAVMLSHGTQDSGAATSSPTTSAQSRGTRAFGPPYAANYAVGGPSMVTCHTPC